MDILNGMLIRDIEEVDAILYEDIKDIIYNKTQLENLLFTTKQIIFKNNDELVEFINKLIEFGFEDKALDYVENLYNKITLDFSNLKKRIDVKDKQ